MPGGIEGTSFIIKELSGQQRTIRLLDRAMPYRPYNLKSTQRVETTWYPGSPEATATILGASLEPTSINGVWKDKYLSNTIAQGDGTSVNVGAVNGNSLVPMSVNGVQVNSVREAATLFRSLCAEGQLMEVAWDQTLRHGHMKEFEENWENVHDLRWDITFEWVSTGDEPGEPAFNTETSTSDTASLMQSQNLEVQEKANPPPFPVSFEFNEALVEGLTTLGQSVDQASGVVANLVSAATTPFDATRRMVAVTGGVANESQEIIDLYESAPPRARNVSGSIALLSYGQIVEADTYARDVTSAARKLKRTAIIKQTLLAEQIRNDLLGSYRAREGDDLRDVSRLFYGTPFNWRRLLTFNELSSSALVSNQLVLVPRQTVES